MTDINEAIARWMGWYYSEQARMWLPPEGKRTQGPWQPQPPQYTESLDAQVPVWEALDVGDVQLATLTNGGWRATLNVLGHTGDYVEDGDKAAEAAARAIHAALVAMGEVEE